MHPDFKQCTKCRLIILKDTEHCLYCAVCGCPSCISTIHLDSNVIKYHNGSQDSNTSVHTPIVWTYNKREMVNVYR